MSPQIEIFGQPRKMTLKKKKLRNYIQSSTKYSPLNFFFKTRISFHKGKLVLNSQFSILNSQFLVLSSQFSILNSQFQLLVELAEGH